MSALSYVVTSYNNAAYIEESITSILAQSRPVAEILIVDDASTDTSMEILEGLVDRGPIRLVRRPENLGAGANRHLGFMEARGPFVTNLAGDDRIDPAKVENEMRLLERAGDGLAFSDAELVYPDGRRWRLDSRYFAELDSPKARVEAMLTRPGPLPHHMIYAKSLYEQAGGYDTTAGLYEDWSLKLRLAATEASWVHTGEIGLYYNQHGAGLSASSSILHAYWRLYVLGRNYEWIAGLISEDATLACLRGAADLLAKPDQPAETQKLGQAFRTALERPGRTIHHLPEALDRLVAERGEGRVSVEIAGMALRQLFKQLQGGSRVSQLSRRIASAMGRTSS